MQVLIVSLIFAKACGVLVKLINDKLKHRKVCHIDDFNGQEYIWLWLTENRTQGGLNKPGVYFPHLTQNLELRGPSPSSCPRVLKEPSDYPPLLCHPHSLAFDLIVLDWLFLEVHPGSVQGNGGNIVFYSRFWGRISLLKLPSVFLWLLFATWDSGTVTAFPASLTEVGKEKKGGTMDPTRFPHDGWSGDCDKNSKLWLKQKLTYIGNWPALIIPRNLDYLVMLLVGGISFLA